jgi:hypothetical protein
MVVLKSCSTLPVKTEPEFAIAAHAVYLFTVNLPSWTVAYSKTDRHSMADL